MELFPGNRRFNSYVGHLRRTYGERLQKLVIDAGFTCPNRDGKVGTGGCSFCDNAAFHPGYSTPGKSITRQLDEGIEFHKVRYRNAGRYIAYFQSFSGTYAPIDVLRSRYTEALSHPEVFGIAIGTRPDCVSDEVFDLLEEIRSTPLLDGRTPEVFLEFGIESCFDATLLRVGRGHDFERSRNAVREASRRGFPVCGHFILGLPGETREMMVGACDEINALPLTSVKFHQLQLIKGTRMEKEFETCPEDFVRMDLPEYIDFMIDILERLRPDLLVERVAGEVPPRFVGEPQWGLVRNQDILRMLEKRMDERNALQGRLYLG